MMPESEPTMYKITGPLPVAHKNPGSVVSGDDLTDLEHLLAIGYVVRVDSGTSSSTIQKQSKLSQEKS
jgi:hypothetical protein